jgi:hypothetical protein
MQEDGWDYGPLMSQTAHAAVAVSLLFLSNKHLSTRSLSATTKPIQVLHETKDRQETIDYLADLKNMHKVRWVLRHENEL